MNNSNVISSDPCNNRDILILKHAITFMINNVATQCGCCSTYLLLLDKVHEVCPLDLHRLTLAVVQSQDEVEEVGLAQVRRRLLLEVSPGQTHAAAETEAQRGRC